MASEQLRQVCISNTVGKCFILLLPHLTTKNGFYAARKTLQIFCDYINLNDSLVQKVCYPYMNICSLYTLFDYPSNRNLIPILNSNLYYYLNQYMYILWVLSYPASHPNRTSFKFISFNILSTFSDLFMIIWSFLENDRTGIPRRCLFSWKKV